ncbi:MAG: hypothetical protein NWQ54_06870 [Paraglaciecola sp.]|nr:hypothetical protein [Paraglaciecola sp.]
MSLIEDNFTLTAELDELAAVKIQSMLRLLNDNTATQIKLERPVIGGNTIYFTLVSGSYSDIDLACDYKDIQRTNNELQA